MSSTRKSTAIAKSSSKAAVNKTPSKAKASTKAPASRSKSQASVSRTPSRSKSAKSVAKTPTSKAKTPRKAAKRRAPEPDDSDNGDAEDQEQEQEQEQEQSPDENGETAKKQRPLEIVSWPSLDAFRDMYYSGTEWVNYDKLFVEAWDFSHLEEHLSDRSQFGHSNTPYLFGLSEPTLIDGLVLPVPVIVVVDCAIPPPDKVGISSVQRGGELVKNFSELRMSWLPCWEGLDVPLLSAYTSRPPSFFYLHSRKRDAWLKKLSEEKKREFDYVNPWIFLPHKQRFDGSTTAKWMLIVDGQGKPMEYDWEMDEPEDRAVELMEELDIDAKYKDMVIESINEHVAESKKRYDQEKAAFEERLNSISQREKDALRDIKLVKYYPKNFSDSTSTYINRYYGHAQKVFPEPQVAEYS